jgi:DNA repair protein SbcC/Rad50
MIVERITVRNWRGYREPHAFELEEGINVLAGRNEAGKSTLFEALTRVLFDRHSSKTEEVRAMQPLGSSLGPEAEVRFRIGGTRYRVLKRFLVDPVSTLWSERDGVWERDHEGDAADARLREVLRGEATARTAARPEQRGLAQALWYLQTDGALPDGAWSDGVRHGLAGLVRVAARSPIETAMLERIEAAYAEDWTPTGRPSSKGELRRLEDEIPKLRGALDELERKAQLVDDRRADLEERQLQLEERRRELAAAEVEAAETAAAVAAASGFEVEWQQCRAEAEEAGRVVERLEADALRLRERRAEVRERRERVGEGERRVAELAAEMGVASERRDGGRRRAKEELEPSLAGLRSTIDAFGRLVELRRLERERALLETRLARVERVRADLEEARRLRAELDAPDDAAWRRFRDGTGRLATLDAQLEASTIRVAFAWEGSDREVTPRPPVEARSGEYVVFEPTEFRIDGVGTVRIRGALPDLAALREEHARRGEELRHTLERYGAADAAELASAVERAKELHARCAALEARLDEELADGPAERDALTTLDRQLEHLRRGVAELAEETRDATLEALQASLATHQSEEARLQGELAQATADAEAAEARRLGLVEEHGAAALGLATERAKVDLLEGLIVETIEPYGTADRLEKLRSEADARRRGAEEAVAAMQAAYEQRVETPRRLDGLARKRVHELEASVRSLEGDIKETLARIEEAAAQGNYAARADVEIDLDWKRRRRDVLQRRADGAKLLRDLVQAHEQARSAALAGPVRELVDRWLRLLSDDGYEGLRIDHDLKPTGVRVRRYGLDLPLGSLSHGAQEQVVVLLRLAIACLVSGGERNLVVIDDRLVNADAMRMKRLCLILAEVAKSCQIVIATCSEAPYAGLGARVVRVPGDGVLAAAT